MQSLVRQDTDDAILSYYQSADAAQGWHDPSQPRATSPPVAGAVRRTSIPSQGGTDRRRLAIVEMDACKPSLHDRSENSTRRSDSGGGPPNNSRSRLEANLGGLALVAPPDASPQCYSALTPPGTPPVSKLQPSITVSRTLSSTLSSNNARSPSDAFGAFPKVIGHVPRKSSREVAIVGTTSFPASASVPQQPSNTLLACDSLRPPIFQIPQSRSPSPGVSDISDSGCSTGRGRQRKDALAPGVSPVKEVKEVSTPVRTPNIGESKHISDRVAGPVVISLFPQSPSPSPVLSSSHSSSQDLMSPTTNLSSPLTPSTALTSPATTPRSPYLHYQPGLHATAGPLPPPPQAVGFTIDPKSPPPRPPRHSPIRRKDDLEAMKQVLQLPSHVSAALRAKSVSSLTEKEVVSTNPQKVIATVPPPTDSPQSSHESLGYDPKPHHVREGAFPPSRLCTFGSDAPHEEIATSLPRLDSMDDLVASIGLTIDDMGIINSSDVPPPNVVEPPRGHEGQNGRKGLEIRRTDNLKLNLGRSLGPERPHVEPLPSSPCSDESDAQGWVDPDRTLTRVEETVPPVPAKNDLPYLDTKSSKNALNMKRFSSLPRTPSLMSLNRPSIRSKRSSGTHSPSVAFPQPKPPVRRTKSAHPPAMFFADVTVKRTPLERSIGYAYKINELYNCDCGLGDWIAETRYKALHPHSSVNKRSTVNSSRGPRAPTSSSPSIAPRHISQSSTDSGVTFPIRADAYSATDLAPRAAGDASPPNALPPLPYPALAAAPRGGPSRASTIIATSSTSSSRSAVSPTSLAKSPGNFFTSLGRRASIKKEKPLTPPSPAKTLSRSPPRNKNEQTSPRPANLPLIAPSVPGGPRAPPNRMQRSQTIILTSQNSTNGTGHQRSSTMTRKPSLFDGRWSVEQQHDSLTTGAEFNRQVDKLAALLPKADRNVLAIYLRRAGQDILAIGQYLEDEKNGTLRYE
ncbi:hypothetical protein OG21DRAFT_875816 [Imleria badia]|nr:hypothetical protein OG21DRAFT_875816 [Imleria badia]